MVPSKNHLEYVNVTMLRCYNKPPWSELRTVPGRRGAVGASATASLAGAKRPVPGTRPKPCRAQRRRSITAAAASGLTGRPLVNEASEAEVALSFMGRWDMNDHFKGQVFSVF